MNRRSAMTRRVASERGASPFARRVERWAGTTLLPSLLERDVAAAVDRRHFTALGSLGLFRPMALGERVDAYRALARGSLDLPFTVSAIAHGIGAELLETFGTARQKFRYRRRLRDGTLLATIANAEERSGTDVLSLRSSLEATGEMATLVLEKPMATNASDADLAFVSVWNGGSLEVFVVETAALERKDLRRELVGFRTGLTGGLRTATPLPIVPKDARLGAGRRGAAVLKSCFNAERVAVAAALVGILEALTDRALAHVADRKSFGKPLSEHQYVQEKIVALYAKAERIRCLVESVVRDGARGLADEHKRLCLLKMTAVEDAFAAAVVFYEVFGAAGYRNDHLAQKVLRDILALKMLGGTKEQQKILLFQELLRERNGGAR